MLVEEVNDARELEKYRQEWMELAAASPDGDFFQAYEWVTTWLNGYWKDRPVTFLFVRSGDRLVGLAPLLESNGTIGCPRSLVFPGFPRARRADILHAGQPEEVLLALFAHLKQTRRKVQFRLPNERSTSSVLQALRDLTRRRAILTMERRTTPSPLLRLEEDWDAYLRSRSHHVRHEFARKKRKLEQAWNVDWSTATTVDQCNRAMTDVLRIERNSWKERVEGSFFFGTGTARFYGALARTCARNGMMRLHLLHLDSRPVAYVYGVAYRNRLYALKTSYDEAYHGWSPGVAVVLHAIQHAFEEGLTAFDFLGQESRWKREIANDRIEHIDLCVYSDKKYRCRLCALRELRVKPYLKRRAPFVVEWTRKLRRRPGQTAERGIL